MHANPVASFGDAGLLLALITTAYAVAASVAGARRGSRRLVASGIYAAHATSALLLLSSVVMWFLILSNDYSVKYVQRHSDAAMPWIYKLTSFWGGLDGSIMWWVLLLALFSSLAIHLNRERHRELIPWVTAILFVVVGFFLLLIIFEKRPFDVFLTETPRTGKGLNPLLQNPYMATHPPSLYLGFVSATVPFAFGLAALITGNLDDSWLASTRRWMLVSWYFLSQGLILGCLWAYEELGWGGYWGWDPVENAGFLPWLTATAFLHSIMVQERRGMLKVWNVSLVIVTFVLTLVGTFMTRSGIVQSVHAFGQDVTLAIIFLSFIGFVLVFSFGFVLYRLPLLRSRNELDSWVSREGAFLANNWVLLSAAFFVLFATLFPTISEAVVGQRITVGPPFFNKWMTPIGLSLVFLTGVGPLIAWRKATIANLKQQFAIPLTAMVSTVALCQIAPSLRGWSYWSFRGDTSGKGLAVPLLVSVICFGLCAFALATIIQEFVRGARVRQHHTKLDFFTSMIGLVARSKRRYGGYLVHVGVVLMFIGFAGGDFKKEAEATLEKGESMKIGRYQVRFDELAFTSDPAKEISTAWLTVFRDGKELGKMAPAKWAFRGHEDEPPTTEVDIRKSVAEDLYLVLNGFDSKEGLANLKAVINPLVNWIWFGFMLLAIGTIIAFLPDRAYALAGAKDAGKKAAATAATALALFLLAGPARADEPPAQPHKIVEGVSYARDNRERELFKRIVCMCGTCGRQTLADCSCGFAHQMRKKIQDLIDAGQSDEQVVEYHLKAYPGESALVVPLDKGFNRLAWVLPYGALLFAAGALVLVLRRWSRRGKESQRARADESAKIALDSRPDDAQYEDKLDDELDRLS
jgi:cytochrome c-type biogenesis protein CcmF